MKIQLNEGLADLYVIYQIIKRIVTPIEKMSAFKTGVIDKDGNILVKPKDRTSEQKKSFGYTDLFALKIRGVMSMIPFGRSKIARYAAALWFLTEGHEFDTLSETELKMRVADYCEEVFEDEEALRLFRYIQEHEDELEEQMSTMGVPWLNSEDPDREIPMKKKKKDD